MTFVLRGLLNFEDRSQLPISWTSPNSNWFRNTKVYFSSLVFFTTHVFYCFNLCIISRVAWNYYFTISWKRKSRENFGSILDFPGVPNKSDLLKWLPLDRGHFNLTFIKGECLLIILRRPKYWLYKYYILCNHFGIIMHFDPVKFLVLQNY